MLALLNSKIFLWSVIVGLLLLVGYVARSCSQIDSEFKAQNTQLARTLDDKAQETLVTLTEAEMKIEAKDSTIKVLLEKLEVKPKNVISIKKVVSEKIVHDTITEFELLEGFDFKTKYSFYDDCFVADVDLSGRNPTIKAHIKYDMTDIAYSKRRNLFNKTYLPRIGKKDIYQTIVMGCGDTIRTNYKLTTK